MTTITNTTTATETTSAPINTTLNHHLVGNPLSYKVGTAGYFRRKWDTQPVKIHDVRGRQEEFNMHDHGFQWCKHSMEGTDFRDADQIKQVVYPEIEALVKKITGATQVRVFSHALRVDSRDKTEAIIKETNAPDDTTYKDVTPARFIHIDQSYEGAVEVLRENIPAEDFKRLSATRWSIINVWRAIKPISKDPFAVCDARSVREEDLVPTRAEFPPKEYGSGHTELTAGTGWEGYELKYHPDQTWYYAKGQGPDEALLLKCFDSIKDGHTARRVPHSAFTDPTTVNDSTRESLEVRCFVFYEDQPLEGYQPA